MIDAGIEQRTDEWFAARLGKATASRFKDIIATTKSGAAGAGRKNYRAELLIERLTGRKSERVKSAAMEWGQDTEELAATTYMMRTGRIVDQVGFLQHDWLAAGASPDGLVGDDGTIEIKCFNTANHIEALKNNAMPPEHMPQVQGQLWIANRQWCDFISFDPELTDNAQIFIQRIPRDEIYIKNLELEVSMFLDEVDADIEFLKQYKPQEVGK